MTSTRSLPAGPAAPPEFSAAGDTNPWIVPLPGHLFSVEQIAALTAPLSRAHVKSRSQSGRSFSYIEGWTVIAEANRIFGFDGWQRQTVEIRCVAESQRGIGREQKPGWGVTYIARVRVAVGPIVREGTGAGHGIDSDLGQAHESAIKEAETDAMKRALMTFGNAFGLALYDKQQSQVSNAPACQDSPVRAHRSRTATAAPAPEAPSAAAEPAPPSAPPAEAPASEPVAAAPPETVSNAQLAAAIARIPDPQPLLSGLRQLLGLEPQAAIVSALDGPARSQLLAWLQDPAAVEALCTGHRPAH